MQPPLVRLLVGLAHRGIRGVSQPGWDAVGLEGERAGEEVKKRLW